MNNQIYNLFRNKKRLKKGKVITFEGIDGSGKRTQVNKLAEYLKELGYKVKVFSFPVYEQPIGKVISSYLTGGFGDVNQVPHELICIAYGADRARLKEKFNFYINNGYIVLCDRYTYSNLFSAAKMDRSKRKQFIEWIENIEFNEMKVVKPDYNFFLYVDPSVSMERMKQRGNREYQQEKEDIHENNVQLLSDAAETYFDFSKGKKDWFIINQMKDGNQLPEDKVFLMIKDKIDIILNNSEKV